MKNTSTKTFIITILRLAIGWHFLYEGISKMMAENWSAAYYLNGSMGIFSGFYNWMGSSEILMKAIDPLNVYGLILIGLCLAVGFGTRIAALLGGLLLTMYYFAYPPFGSSVAMQPVGNIYIVNQQFIEAAILFALVFFKDRGYGIDKLRQIRSISGESGSVADGSRRETIRNLVSLPVLSLVGLGAFMNKRRYGTDSLSGATIKVGAIDIKELKGELPKGKIGKNEISRLVLGGNLIGGWAHARDLIYVSSLFKAYNTEKKIFETLMLAEQAGINAINIGFSTSKVLKKYKDLTGSKIQVITQIQPNKEGDLFANIDAAIDDGAAILQVQGNHSDWMVRDGKPEKIGEMLDYIRKQGYTAGLGAHTIDTLIKCEEMGMIPDYYMKTMHHDNYWSAHPRENRLPFEVDGKKSPDHDQFHNNLFCLYPDRTVEFVNRVKVPVMGYKVLAAGALQPQDGFKWAFENGADWICVGMFDFQIVKDVNITIDVLNNMKKRKRDWYA